MDSKWRPFQGNATDFIEELVEFCTNNSMFSSNAVYEYDPKDPNICRRYEAGNLPRKSVRQISTFYSKEREIMDPSNALAVDEHLLWSMTSLPPVSGMSQQQDLFPPVIDNRIKEQVMREGDHEFLNNQIASKYQELRNLNSPEESSNRPNQRHPTMSNLSNPQKMLLNQGQIRVNSEIEAPNQYAMSMIATQLPAIQKPVCNPYLGAGEVRSQQIPADSLHQPRQRSPSEPRAHAGTDAPTSSGSSDLRTNYSFVQLWKTVMLLFAAINTKSLQLFYRGCEGSIHKAKKDDAAASFCRDLYINFKKERRLVIEDDSKYTLLLNYIPLIKEWLQKVSNPNRPRSNKIPMYTELNNRVEEEGPLPVKRAGQLPEPYAQMIMERGKAYDESERSKKRTGKKNELFKQQDKRFKALGVEVDKELELLRNEFRSVFKREALKERPDARLKQIGKIVKHIQENWHGVQPVEPTHSGRPPNKAFKERQTVCAKATENEPIVGKLLELIRHLRLLCEKYRLGDMEDILVPTREPTTSTSKLDEVSKRCLDLSEADRVILIQQLQDMSTAEENVPEVVRASALPRDCSQETPQFVYEAPIVYSSNNPVPMYFNQQAENSFSLGKTSGAPYNRKRTLDHETNNREGEGKRPKPAPHQPTLAEDHLQNQVWISQPSQQHVAGYQNSDHPPSYASPVNKLTGSIPHYNWESPGVLSATPAASANQFQIKHTVSQQPSGQPNPTVVPEIYVDCQDHGAPIVPSGEQSGKKSSNQPSTESETKTTDPDQPSCSPTQPAHSIAPEQPPPGIHDVTFDSCVEFGLPIGTDGHIDFLEPK